MIFLRGSGPSDLDFGRSEARFFAEHGFRVLLADYLTVTPNLEPKTANYRRWAQVVEDIVADLARPSRQTAKSPWLGKTWAPLSPCLPVLTRWVSTPSQSGRAFSPTSSFPGAEPAPASHHPWRAGSAGPGRQRPSARPSLRAQRLHLRSRNLSRRGTRLHQQSNRLRQPANPNLLPNPSLVNPAHPSRITAEPKADSSQSKRTSLKATAPFLASGRL